MESEIYMKVIKKNAYRVSKNCKNAFKIRNWQKITMEEKITMKENYIKETFMIQSDVASWYMLVSLWKNLIKIVLICRFLYHYYAKSIMVRNLFAIYSKSSRQNLFVSVYSTLISFTTRSLSWNSSVPADKESQCLATDVNNY